MRLIGIVLTVIAVACGDGRPRVDGDCKGSDCKVGGDCEVDGDCPSNLCWDFHDYDALCGGKVCSATCTTDQDCVDLAEDADASSPDRATCGEDQRCDLIGTGLGSFVCA